MTMARNGRKGLYLPLRIDLKQWEKDLAAADADLKEKIKELRSEAARVKLQYDVQIANADAAGDQMRKFQLQQAKLNQLIEIQTTKVRGLEAAWRKEVATSGEASAASDKLARSLAYEQIYLARLQKNLNGMNAGFTTKLADALSSVSPTFAAIRNNVSMTISEFGNLSSYLETKFGANTKKELSNVAANIGVIATSASAAGSSLKKLGSTAAAAGSSFGGKVVDSLSNASPAFSKFRTSVSEAVSEFGKLSNSVKTTVGSNVTAYTAALAANIGAVGKAASSASNYVSKLGTAAVSTGAAFGNNLLSKITDSVPMLNTFRKGISSVVSEFGKISASVKNEFGGSAKSGFSGLVTSIGSIVTAAKSAGVSVAALSTAVAGAAAVFGGVFVASVGAAAAAMFAYKNSVIESAEGAAKASEATFELAERMGLAYDESAKLSGIFAIDGTNYEGYVRALQRFNKSLQGTSEAAKEAREFLKYYGVELQDAAGKQLSITEQTNNIAKAFNNIGSEGEKLDFLVKILGTAGTQYAHLFKGLEDYRKKQEEVATATGVNYEKNHELLTVNNQLAEGYKNLKIARDSVYTDSALRYKNEEVKQLKEQISLVERNNEVHRQHAAVLDNLGLKAVSTKGAFDQLIENMKTWEKSKVVDIASYFGLFDKEKYAAEKAAAEQAEADAAERAEQERQRKEFEDNARREYAAEQKEKEKAEKKLAEVRKKFYAELDAVSQSSYEREIQQIEDKKQKYIEEGMAASEAQKLYDAEKAKIDSKYQQQEQSKYQQQVQAAKNAYDQIDAIYMNSMQKQIANIEKQKQAWIKAGVDEVTATRAAMKQIQEARLQDNESTLRSNVDIIKKARREYESGNQNWMEATKAFADKKWMQGMGINMADLNFFKNMGADIFKELGNASSRMLGDMGGNVTNNNNNTVNVNMSDMMFEDESTMNKFLEKLAGKLIPVLEKAAGVSTGQQAATNNY